MPRIRIVVDPELCIGAASCVTVAPSFFKLSDENKAIVLEQNQSAFAVDGVPAATPEENIYDRIVEVSERTKANILLAAESCPTLAISIFDVETGEKLFPRN